MQKCKRRAQLSASSRNTPNEHCRLEVLSAATPAALNRALGMMQLALYSTSLLVQSHCHSNTTRRQTGVTQSLIGCFQLCNIQRMTKREDMGNGKDPIKKKSCRFKKNKNSRLNSAPYHKNPLSACTMTITIHMFKNKCPQPGVQRAAPQLCFVAGESVVFGF